VAFSAPSSPYPGYPEYRVRTQFGVGPTSRVLRASASKIDFDFGENVSTNHSEYFGEGLGGLDLWLVVYYWADVFPPVDRELEGEFIGKLSALIGVQYTDPDTGDVTLGWFKFSRPSVEPGTAFLLDAWSYNPIPNEPIGAGLPPDLPEPSFAWSEEGLTVSWPEKAWMLRLETTASLTPPIEWYPVVTGGTTVTLPPSEGPAAFFRLVAPDP